MADGGSPTLEVGFAINPEYGELAQLQAVMDSTEAKIVAEAAKIERATGVMINLGGATAKVTSFGNAATRELANATREAQRAEKAGEAMVRQLQRQAETFGKTASEVRNMRAEMRAAAAEERGLTELAGRIRAVNAQIDQLEAGTRTIGGTGKLAGHHMQNLAFQFQDLGIQMVAAAGSSDPLKMAMMAMMQQGSQIGGIMGQAGVGIKAVGAAFLGMSKAILVATVTNPILLGIAAAIGVVAGSVALLTKAANRGADMKAYAASLGLTAKEMRNLDNVTVTWGDTARAVFQVAGRAIWGAIGPAVTSAWDRMKEWGAWIFTNVKAQANFMIGAFVGGYQAIVATWRLFPAAIGDIFVQAVNRAVAGVNFLIEKSIASINWMVDQANEILPDDWKLDHVAARTIAGVQNQWEGAADKVAETWRDKVGEAMGTDYIGNAGRAIGGAVIDQAVKNAQDRLKKQATDKGYLDSDGKAKALTDEQKAYLDAIKAAKEYAEAQLEEAAKVGLSTKELRLHADAAAMAVAPTEELRKAIAAAAATREAAFTRQAATDFDKNVLQPLRDELALYGLVGPARERAALELEKTAFLAANSDDGPEVAAQRWLEYHRLKSELIGKDETIEKEAARVRALNDELTFLADKWDLIARNVANAARGMAEAFGPPGRAVGDLAVIFAELNAHQAQAAEAHSINMDRAKTDAEKQKELAKYQLALSTAQVDAFGDMASAAQGFFKEGSDGYRALQKAEQVFRAVEFALSVKAMAQRAIETAQALAQNTMKAASFGVTAVANALASLPFPANLAAGAATVAALAAIGVSIAGSIGGSKNTLPKSNDGTGTVLGDASAKSESIKNAINALKEVDLLTNAYSRDMASSLRSIDSQIGNVASVIVRGGDINASAGVVEGFAPNTLGKLLGNIPLIGGFLSSLFGSKTSVIGSGLYAPGQSIGSILNRGFDAQTYSDVQKTKRFLGIKTGTSYSTQYANADAGLEAQFTLILRSFNDAIMAAAGPLGESTAAIQSRLNNFVVSIGKIDLKDLTGTEIQEKLSAIFGAAADGMANAAFPGLARFQKVGEGAFETLVRVASTVEAVTNSLAQLGTGAQSLEMDAKLALIDQFDDLSGLTNAVEGYFQAFYTKEEQAAAKLAQFSSVMSGLGLTMPDTIAGFRQLVEAQDLNTDAGRQAYALLLQLAPAFVDLKSSMEGAKSAADILSERQDLQRKLLELQGDTAAIRALDLAKIDASNRALQEQVWALADAQEAAKAAQALADAWAGAGDTIMDEVRRIRGLSDTTGANTYASLLGQFNATTASARGGDLDAAKMLPQLSQALLNAANEVATSRQELDRIRAMTAASLEATYGLIKGTPPAGTTNASLLDTAAASQAGNSASNESPMASLAAELDGLRAELAQMRADNNAGHAANAAANTKTAQILDRVTQATGGDALAVELAA